MLLQYTTPILQRPLQAAAVFDPLAQPLQASSGSMLLMQQKPGFEPDKDAEGDADSTSGWNWNNVLLIGGLSVLVVSVYLLVTEK